MVGAVEECGARSSDDGVLLSVRAQSQGDSIVFADIVWKFGVVEHELGLDADIVACMPIMEAAWSHGVRLSPATRQHVFEGIAPVDARRMHWSMVCCSFLPCRLHALRFFFNSFHSFCFFFTPALHDLQQDDEKKTGSPVLHSPLMQPSGVQVQSGGCGVP